MSDNERCDAIHPDWGWQCEHDKGHSGFHSARSRIAGVGQQDLRPQASFVEWVTPLPADYLTRSEAR